MAFPEIKPTSALHDAGKGGFVSDVHSGDHPSKLSILVVPEIPMSQYLRF